jgi:hypothetical protein
MRVKRGDLGPLKEIASGAFGKVFRVENYHLPGDQADLAYKEFTQEEAQQAHAAQAAVAFRDGLSTAERADLDRYAAWPRSVVEKNGLVTGLLMPLIAKDFFRQLNDDKTGARTSKPCEMQWLIATQAQRDAADIDLPAIDKTQRLALLAQLVYAIGRLHRHGWVFGDLSFKNAVFALDPPRMMLIDCDGAASVSDPRRQQAHTPSWIPPECRKSPGQAHLDVQDTVTDSYKLGLAVLRCLTPGKGAGWAENPARLGQELDALGLDLVARAVGADRRSRPTAKELYAYLYTLVKPRAQAPEVVSARLATPLRVRGMDARVEWEIRNVAEVRIRVGTGTPITVTVPRSGQAGPRLHVFPARESGPVTIEARNRYGAIRVDLGELILYEIPEFDPTSLFGTLPRLAVPELEAFNAGVLAPALASLPQVRFPELPSVPSVPTLDLAGLLRQTLLHGTASVGSVRFPDLGELTAGPTREIAKQLTAQAGEFAEAHRASHLKALANTEDDDE